MSAPVSIVERCGVRNRSWTTPKMLCGKSPSRAIARKMRAWLRKITNSTLVMPASAPIAISQAEPRNKGLFTSAALWRKAAATGAPVSIL